MFTHQVFFIIPCLDVYQKIDMRTSSYDVPPQEVILCKEGSYKKKNHFLDFVCLVDSTQDFFPLDPDQGQCDGICECNHVLQGDNHSQQFPTDQNLRTANKVKDATSAVANVDDYTGSARLLAATTLREIFQYFHPSI